MQKWSAEAADSGPTRRAIGILEQLRKTCPNSQFILRGLGPKTADPGTWPNLFTVVRHLNLLTTHAPIHLGNNP